VPSDLHRVNAAVDYAGGVLRDVVWRPPRETKRKPNEASDQKARGRRKFYFI